jgi:ubiquinone/menaquinone biosynthesis C-methylase UbiE
MKKILDATCGTRSIWFDKQCQEAVFFDQREGVEAKKMGTKRYERTMVVEPDVIGDFRQLPFEDESFYHVVFDPPHVHCSEKAWLFKMYGTLPENWAGLIHDGFWECMRVLKPYGTLVFKWSDLEISTRQVIDAIGCTPLYGHRSGKKMNTHWMVFMKGVSDLR